MLYLLFAVVLATLVGLLVATLGAWKDTLWEQFSPRKFLRTPIITVFAGGFLVGILGIPANFWEWILYILSAIAVERLLVDGIYKGIRRKRPSKFLRPQRDTRWLRERLFQILQKER